MKNSLEDYIPIAQSISLLFHPYVEIVIHDLKTGRIAAIFNSFSKRKIGDESLLQDIDDFSQIPDIFPPYFKTNWDGRKLKSTTATLKNAQGKPIGLFCVNLDLSKWEEMHRVISDLLQQTVNDEQPEILFNDDWREKINVCVSSHLKQWGISIQMLRKDKKQKKELVHNLYKAGAFKAKNAAFYIGEILGISRATIYNYLRKE